MKLSYPTALPLAQRTPSGDMDGRVDLVKCRMIQLLKHGTPNAGTVYHALKQEFPWAGPELLARCAEELLDSDSIGFADQ